MARKVRYSVLLSQRWQEVAVFFEAYPQAMEQLCEHVGVKDIDFFALSVRGMIEAADNQVPTELKERYKNATVRDYSEMVNGLKEGLEKFIGFMEKTTPPQTFEQKKMMRGVLNGNLEEGVLMTLKSCFSLHDLEAATNLTVYEYMMARKECYNEAIISYNQSCAIAVGLR